ncbi:MAG: Imm27 family immunity protein [Polyangiales bacterium]
MEACPCTRFSKALDTLEEVRRRCEEGALIKKSLVELHSDSAKWMAVHRCRVCGQLWASEYPFGGMHGGGPQCFYQVEAVDPSRWLAHAPLLTSMIAKTAEDRATWEQCGPEIGPEPCRTNGCSRRRVQHSVMCRRHHFVMIKGYEYEQPPPSDRDG